MRSEASEQPVGSVNGSHFQDFFYKIYKILKIICNIQNNVIQIAQVFEGYLLNTFDNIFQ